MGGGLVRDLSSLKFKYISEGIKILNEVMIGLKLVKDKRLPSSMVARV